MGILSSMWVRNEPPPVMWAESAPDITALDLRVAIQTLGQQAPITVKGRHWGGVRLAFKF